MPSSTPVPSSSTWWPIDGAIAAKIAASSSDRADHHERDRRARAGRRAAAAPARAGSSSVVSSSAMITGSTTTRSSASRYSTANATPPIASSRQLAAPRSQPAGERVFAGRVRHAGRVTHPADGAVSPCSPCPRSACALARALVGRLCSGRAPPSLSSARELVSPTGAAGDIERDAEPDGHDREDNRSECRFRLPCPGRLPAFEVYAAVRPQPRRARARSTARCAEGAWHARYTARRSAAGNSQDAEAPEPRSARRSDAEETKTRSAEPATKTSTTQVKTPTPIAVRHGRVARAVEQVVRPAVAGERAARATARRRAARTTSEREQRRRPRTGSATTVQSPITTSNPRHSRSAPISQPRYQSGCAPFVAVRRRRTGPHSQIGLIWTRPPSSEEHGRDGAAAAPSERGA